MKLYIILPFLAFCSTVSAQFMQACSSDNRDCSCKDVSYEICHTPPAAQELHVGTLEECIQNCDLFGSFGQCNYLLYWETGPDENCKLIADTTLEQYLDACRVFGQPLRDAYGDCVSGFISNICAMVGCKNAGCHQCDVNDACGLYAQTECLKIGSPGETIDALFLSFETCLSLCTNQQQSNPFTYVVWDKELQTCICYPDGLRECQITAVPFGMTLAQVETCDGCLSDADCPAARPICSVLTGRCVECETKADCTDPSKPICNLDANICIKDDCSSCVAPTAVCHPDTGACIECLEDADCTDTTKPDCDKTDYVCKPECTVDTDCAAQDYCQCHDGSDDGSSCPAGGACVLGCRDPGTPCATEAGDCSGNHECIVVGDSVLTKLTIETRVCAGCSSLKAASGATIQMTVNPPGGEESCSTEILDDPASTDYSGQAVFEDFVYLSHCFMANIGDLTGFQVTWTGAGTWTPEKFTLERRKGSEWPYCCFNDAGLTVSDAQTQEFTCVESSAATHGMDCKP